MMKSAFAATLLVTPVLLVTAILRGPQVALEDEPGSSKQCPIDSGLSCHSDGIVKDTCCYNTPGGLILQTQFWDAQPATGPDDSWTIHGLWPDNCDGSFEMFCDKQREYKNITQIIEAHRRPELLDYMKTYWKDWKGDDENLWEHEWNKHGTCISTLDLKCYPGYQPQVDVVDYFLTTTQVFKGLDTYKILADAGIKPDSNKKYTLKELQNALSKFHGDEVTLNCKNGQLKEVWYFFNVRGSVQSGEWVAAGPGGSPSTCPQSGIKYLPKRGKPRPTTTRRTDPTSTKSGTKPTGTSGLFSGRGYLEVTTGGQRTGCLISYGTWYTSGTCANFHATPSEGGFTLSSSKGTCGIGDSLLFECDLNVKPTVFQAINGNLAVNGDAVFTADEVPRGSNQVPVYSADRSVELTISWKEV